MMEQIPAPAVPYVPARLLTELDNRTAYPALVIDRMGPGRRFHDIVTVKATFDYEHGECRLAEVPAPLNLCDECWDETKAEFSSLRHASDIELSKPGTDVLVTGTARNRDSVAVPRWQGMLRVRRGEDIRFSKVLTFSGPRQWRHSLLGGWRLTDPEPTDAVPLRYELAWGGHWLDPSANTPEQRYRVHKTNPSGSGFLAPDLDISRSWPGPQITLNSQWPERPNDPRIAVAGFGPIARFWAPRVAHAGTYDAAWHQSFHKAKAAGELPDYPTDFDLRFHQCAPPDQIVSPHLIGDELIELPGLTADLDGVYLTLPGQIIQAELSSAHGTRTERLVLDIVLVDLDARQVHLTWRLVLPRQWGVTAVQLDSISFRSAS